MVTPKIRPGADRRPLPFDKLAAAGKCTAQRERCRIPSPDYTFKSRGDVNIRTPAWARAIALLAAVVALGGGALASPLYAQDAGALDAARQRAEQLLGRPLTDREILRLLQQSGLTADQVRERLQRQGLPPGAADPYLDVLEGRADRVPEGTDPLVMFEALTGARLRPEATFDTTGLASLPPPQAPAESARAERPGPPVFGRELFTRASSQFAPVTMGPVPPDYRVGPDDELVLVLTGDVELAYRLTVSREGWVVIPDVGRVFVNGLSLAELESALRRRLAQSYSGLTGGTDATTFMDVSLGKLRVNQVFVIGEVVQPGSYSLSSLSTALTALYVAGGPNRGGSFRRIAVNRGGKQAATVDLYEYLLHGRAEQDVRLEQGDVVFVPVASRRVEVDGAVVRPGIYEMKEGEGLNDLLQFAGGMQPDAYLARVQIERVLPAAQREPGLHKVLLDVPVGDLGEDAGAGTELVDGDRITVFAVLDQVRNAVRITGGVWRPGEYGVAPGLRLWDLIERAGGLLPDTYAGRAQIQRLEEDYTRRMIPVSLERDASGAPRENPEIRPFDQVYVFARRNLREERVVSIGGWVRSPGVYPFLDGITVRDLILRAGGLRTGAYLGQADVARVVIAQARGDTITRHFTVPLDSSVVFDAARRAGDAGTGGAGGSGGTPDGRGGGRAHAGADGPDFVLQSLDAVYVRKAPGFEPQQSVMVTGQVMFPGPYSLQTRSERIVDLIQRAGGLTPEAYAEGVQLWRREPVQQVDTLSAAQIAGQAFGDTSAAGLQTLEDSLSTNLQRAGIGVRTVAPTPGVGGARAAAVAAARGVTPETGVPSAPEITRVGIDFPRAMRDPRSAHNILIEPGDSLFVPSFIATVDVRGEVGSPTKVLFKNGAGLSYYINRAGGYTQDADKGRTRIQFANGEMAARGGKFLFFGGGIPEPDPGSVIMVPTKRPKHGGINFTQLATVFTSLASAVATIVIVSTR